MRSLQRLAEGVLTQLSTLMAVECAGILVLREGGDEQGLSVLAGSGCYSEFAAAKRRRPLEQGIAAAHPGGFRQPPPRFLQRPRDPLIGTGSGRELAVLLDAEKKLSDTDQALVEVFSAGSPRPSTT